MSTASGYPRRRRSGASSPGRRLLAKFRPRRPRKLSRRRDRRKKG